MDVCKDIATAFKLVYETSRPTLLRSWLFVPTGILFMLVACFGADVLLKLAGSSFPPSVAVLVLLFLNLLLSEWLLGSNRTRRLVRLIEVPGDWSLRWINAFFTPTFVLLPLSSPIGIIEVLKIIAVFATGFVVMMVFTVYMTRGLQLITGASKRAHIHRSDELGRETDEIPIAEPQISGEDSVVASTTVSASTSTVALSLSTLAHPARSQAPARIPSQSQVLLSIPLDGADANRNGLRVMTQTPLPPPRSKLWATFVSSHMVWIIYGAIFLLVGLPVYFVTNYGMPLHVTATVLAYLAAMSVPPRWRQYLHPVLVSSLITVLSIWVLGLAKGQSIQATLTQYRTGLKYLQLWHGARTDGKLPGAGDMFGTVLDASIVALALPMYQHRRELREHFAAIIVPNILVSIGSLFAYPYICFAIGINAERSLAFAARSITLALGTPAVENLGGDVKTMAALVITSGILGSIMGPWMLRLLRITDDDYVTRGVTLGANSGAIATAFLLRSDPRAAALSSLSMSLFGTVSVLFTSIPPIVAAIRSLVGLS